MLTLTYETLTNLTWRPLKLFNHMPTDWEGTICQFLALPNVKPETKLWVAHKVLDDKTLRLFAVDWARLSLAKLSNPDPRSVTACDVAERFAYGKATVEELHAARSEAVCAIYSVHAAGYDASACVAASYAVCNEASYAASAYTDSTVSVTDQEMQVTRLISVIEQLEGNSNE